MATLISIKTPVTPGDVARQWRVYYITRDPVLSRVHWALGLLATRVLDVWPEWLGISPLFLWGVAGTTWHGTFNEWRRSWDGFVPEEATMTDMERQRFFADIADALDAESREEALR